MVGGCGCDALLFIVDAHRCRRPDPRVERLVESAAENLGRLRYAEETGLRALSVLALNKVDLFEAEDRDELKRLARRLSAMHPFDHLYPISAKPGRGPRRCWIISLRRRRVRGIWNRRARRIGA